MFEFDASIESGASVVDERHVSAVGREINHLVLLFNENLSFDHYFATYPKRPIRQAKCLQASRRHAEGEQPRRCRAADQQPNFTKRPTARATDPFRLDRSQAATAEQNHSYTPEQEAYDNGKRTCSRNSPVTARRSASTHTAPTDGYFDGNTVTAFWNYAQNFAMNDNAYTDTYGPSTPGAVNVISGQTNGVTNIVGNTSSIS